MRYIPLTYQTFRSIVYHWAERVLEIELADGTSKRIKDVCPKIYTGLMNASLPKEVLTRLRVKLNTN